MSRFVWLWNADLAAALDARARAHASYRRARRAFAIACLGFLLALGTFLYVLVDTVT